MGELDNQRPNIVKKVGKKVDFYKITDSTRSVPRSSIL